MNQKGQETSPPMALERRKTLTMTWEGLGEDDDDNNFFESFDRLSSAVSIDLASSGSDDDEYDDGRMSFASAISSISIKSSMSSAPMEDLSLGMDTNIFGDYNMWMSEPGSITERRRRLFQDMGLSSNKNLLKKVLSKKTVLENEQQKIKKDDVSEKVPKQKELPSSDVVLVRSRSDGDIDMCSVNTKMRKEELVGTVSKQRLTRTSSTLLTPQAGIYPYAMRVSQNRNKERGVTNEASAMSSIMSNGHFGSFFLIKDLDSGKEFIVKEFNDDGMKLSEVQTGKQLTMEEFEKSVGYSPVVKELMRRENISRGLENGRKISANSYFSKSFRNSKRRGAALLKNIKGVANSISGSIVEREKEQIHLETEQARNNSNNTTNKNLSSKWIKVRQQGKSIKEFTAMHLCQEIQAHEGSIWTIKFSPDARYLASAGEDKVVHVWEVQECEVMSDFGFATSANSPDHPSLGDISPLPSERGKERAPLAELSPTPTNKKRGKGNSKKKGNSIPDYVYVPETVFSLSEKPVCSFSGHQDDVLDLSWSKSQLLLSASMDKTVRLWDMETKSCLKLFAHNDYVTCIQFNPIDDNYFISGSLDAKVRIWSIPDRQLVDYTDLHEMVTAARYTPDGEGALIGSHKGGYRLYSTTDCCLEQKDQIELRQRKKKEAKKITGFEFAPGNPSEVLVTSADSRIRIVDGSDVTHKFRGFRNTSSQISASFSADGKYIVSASEDSQVYIWKREELRNSGAGKSKSVLTTCSHEHFQCKDVSVATPWPGSIKHEPPLVEVHSKRHSKRFISPQNYRDENTLGVSSRQMLPPLPKKTSVIDEDHNLEDGTNSKRHLPPLPKKHVNLDRSQSCHDEEPPHRKLPPRPKKNSSIDENASYQEEDYTEEKSKRHLPPHGASENTNSTKKNTSFDRASSCLEEDPSRVSRTDSEMGIGDSFSSDYSSIRYGDSSSISASSNSASQSWSSSWSIAEGNHSPGGNTIQANAWGMVIVTAGLGGEIRAYQNLGLPVKVGRQANLFRDLT